MDSLGCARCDPPAGWEFMELHPRNSDRVCAELGGAMARGALELGDVRAWSEAVIRHERAKPGGPAGGSEMEVQAKRWPAEVEARVLAGARASGSSVAIAALRL